jgi:hypothetical protein
MKTIRALLCTLAVAAVGAFQAHANLVSLGDHPGGSNSNPDTQEGLIEGILGEDLDFLYRFPSGEGDFDAFFDVTDNGDGTADVEWDLTGSGKELWAVGVKAGPDFIHWYSVTEDQRLVSGGVQVVTAPDNIDSISHLSFFGKAVGSPVPDATATLALMGLSVAGLQLVRRHARR